MISRLFEDPFLKVSICFGYLYLWMLVFRKGVKIGRRCVFKGAPIIQNYGGKIRIGNKVTLYNVPYGYFAHFTNRSRLFVEDGGVIEIGDNTRINGSTIHAREGIILGKNVLIAASTSIIDSNGHSVAIEMPENRIYLKDTPKRIVINDNVWIGTNCVVLKGVTIGAGAIVSSGTIVNRDVPEKMIAYGNPMEFRAVD